MIGAALLILLGILGAMQAPVWAVAVVGLMLGGLCSLSPALRRVAWPLVWGAVLALSAAAYGLGYAIGLWAIAG